MTRDEAERRATLAALRPSLWEGPGPVHLVLVLDYALE